MTNYKLKMFCFLGSLSGAFKDSFILVWGIVSLGHWCPPITRGHGVIFQKNGDLKVLFLYL